MFFRKVKAKNETYLRLVQSVRRKNKVSQKVIINFGNIRTLKPEFVNWLVLPQTLSRKKLKLFV